MTPKQTAHQQSVLELAHHNYKNSLSHHAFFKIHDHLISEDLVQNTFMKTWMYLVKGGKIDVMKSFLYHVLDCLIIDEYRKIKPVSLDNLLEKGFEPNNSIDENPMNLLDGKSALTLITRLPEKHQKVMRMKYIQDLSLEEMSMVTGQTKNSLAVQTYRGLEKLKVLYSHQ